MRRLAAVFTGRKSSKSDIGSSDPRSTPEATPKGQTVKTRHSFFRTLTKGPSDKDKRHQPPPLVSSATDVCGTSSTSSSGGPSTPLDDSTPSTQVHGKRNWRPFISEKSAATTPSKDLDSRPYLPRPFTVQDDDTSESSESEIDESSSFIDTKLPVSPTAPLSPMDYLRLLTENALAPPYSPPPLVHVPNSPHHPRSSNPSKVAIQAPKECLRAAVLRTRLLSRLTSQEAPKIDTQLGRELATFQKLASINAKTGRPPPASRRVGSLVLDDSAVKPPLMVKSFSHGLKKWMDRPCFEDRMVVYLPNPLGAEVEVLYARVYASAAVEALEVSERIQVLAGSDSPLSEPMMMLPDIMFSSSSINLTPPLMHTPYTESPSSSAPATPSVTSSTISLTVPGAKPSLAGIHKPAPPSPLRIASTDNAPSLAPQPIIPPAIIPRSVSSSKHPSSPTSVKFSPAATTGASTPAVSSPSAMSPTGSKPVQSVRFAEEDKEDSVPLEYVLRIKRARSQKARFLAAEKVKRQEEQKTTVAATTTTTSTPPPRRSNESSRTVAEERRRFDEERKRHEADRRKQDEERRRWEQERAQWEREKRDADEERKKRAYMDEVTASRSRRESARFGSLPMGKANGGVVVWEGDREKERERRGREKMETYARPRYDESPAREYGHGRSGSQTQIQVQGTSLEPKTKNQATDSSSPGSSRPPSTTATGSVRGSSLYSTPPSSTSALDLRQRKESKTGRSVAGTSTMSAPATPMYFSGGTAIGYPWAMGTPPVPAMPTNIVPIPVAVPMMPMAVGMNMNMGMMSYGVEMPLLPPSAPFMMGGHSKGHGRSGNGQRSHSSSPVRTPGNRQGSESERSERSVPRTEPATPAASSSSRHHRRASGDVSTSYSHGHGRTGSGSGSRSPYTNPQTSTSSLKSSRTNVASMPTSMSHPQSSAHVQRPVPTSGTSWAQQPGFQNLSRPSQGTRRLTMIT